MVHVDEEEERESVCVHMLPSGVSAMPATNWLYASWIMDQVSEGGGGLVSG